MPSLQGMDPHDVSLEQAVELLAAKAAKMQAKAATAGVPSQEPGGVSASKKSVRTKAAGTREKLAQRNGGADVKDAKGSKVRKARPRAAGAKDGVQTANTEGEAPSSTRKRGLNPYMQWKQQRWPSLKAEHPGMSFKELMSLTSEEWANLDPAVKHQFEQTASNHRTQTTQTVSA